MTSLPSWVIEAAESIRRMEGDTFQSIKVDHKTLEWAEAIWRAYEAREGSWEQRRDGTGMAGGSGR